MTPYATAKIGPKWLLRVDNNDVRKRVEHKNFWIFDEAELTLEEYVQIVPSNPCKNLTFSQLNRPFLNFTDPFNPFSNKK